MQMLKEHFFTRKDRIRFLRIGGLGRKRWSIDEQLLNSISDKIDIVLIFYGTIWILMCFLCQKLNLIISSRLNVLNWHFYKTKYTKREKETHKLNRNHENISEYTILFLYCHTLSKINMHVEKKNVHLMFEAVVVNNLFSLRSTCKIHWKRDHPTK